MLSKGMQKLVVDYAAHVSHATSFADIDWEPLARRLKVPPAVLVDAIQAQGEAGQGKLWLEAIEERIKHVQASQGFTSINWERIEGKAVDTIARMLDAGTIRDPSELLAVAKIANQMNRGIAPPGATGTRNQNGSVNVSIDFGRQSADEDEEDDMNHVPGPVNAVKIDLSPRTAESLRYRRERSETRVIDAQRVDVTELRTLSMGGSTDDEEGGEAK